MNPTRFARTLLIAGLTLAPFAVASSDNGIIKCIGEDGQVTLTDTACPGGARSVSLVPAAVAADSEPAPAASQSVTRSAAMLEARLPDRASLRAAMRASVQPPLRRFAPPARSLARDVATLKAARQAMTLMDGAAASMRSRVAGLH